MAGSLNSARQPQPARAAASLFLMRELTRWCVPGVAAPSRWECFFGARGCVLWGAGRRAAKIQSSIVRAGRRGGL
jgi:hypothetical protein